MISMQQMECVIKHIIQYSDRNVVLDGDRFASFYADLSRDAVCSSDAQRHIQLIKAAYIYVPAQMEAFSRALTQGSQVKAAYDAARTGLYEAFFPPGDADALIHAMMTAFGYSPGAEGAVESPVINPARLSDALEALDRRYGNELWSDGIRLAAGLRDEAPDLKQEWRLIQRVYGCAGAEIGMLMAQISLNGHTDKAIASLQYTLHREMIADVYIDGFLGALLDVFGIAYHPLVPVPTKQPASPAANSVHAGQNAAGAGQQAAGTGVPVQSGNRNGRGHKKAIGVLLLAAAVVLAAGVWFVSRSGADPQQEQTEPRMEQTQPPTETEPLPTQPQAVYPEVYEGISHLAIQDVDEVVYGSNVTDLSNYTRFDYGGWGIAAAPTDLYMTMERGGNKDMSTRWLRFSGSDGSMLEYLTGNLFTTTWYPSVRDELPILQARYEKALRDVEVLTEVHYDVTEEAGSWGHVHLTGTDAENPDLVVHVFISIFGEGEWDRRHMIIKYPRPVSEEDRLIKEYYVECLHRMCELTRSPNRLRLYQQYLENVEPEAVMPEDTVYSYREDSTDVSMTDIQIQPKDSTYNKYYNAVGTDYYNTFTGRIPLFRFSYCPDIYDQVSFTNEAEGADVRVEFTSSDGSYLYMSAVKTEIVPGDYSKDTYKSQIASSMTEVKVLESFEISSAAGDEWAYYVTGWDAADDTVVVYACARKTADAYMTMILKYPYFEESVTRIKMLYYAQAMVKLCGFVPDDGEIPSYNSIRNMVIYGE